MKRVDFRLVAGEPGRRSLGQPARKSGAVGHELLIVIAAEGKGEQSRVGGQE